MPYATYRFNKIIAAETIRFIVTVAIVVYKGLKLVVYRMLTDNTPVHVGLMAASPDGNGFNATFEHFKVKHLPDLRRQEWLKKNVE